MEQSPGLDFSRFLRFILKKSKLSTCKLAERGSETEWLSFKKHLGFSVFKNVIFCRWKSVFKIWPMKSSTDSGCRALLTVSILFLPQLLLSDVGWQLPPVPF